MVTRENDPLEGKLDEVIRLLQHILALQLADRGVKQIEIGKHLHVATSTVGKLLKGVKNSDD